MTEIITLAGIALADALNPFSIAAMLFLLATDKPVTRGLMFIFGTFAVYLPFGVALLEGWTALFGAVLPLLPTWTPSLLEMLAGLVCLAIAGHTFFSSAGEGTSPMPSPSKLSAWGTVLFAVASTIADLPTAVPYFAAASRIATLSTDAWVRYVWLFVYNLVYVGPLIAMLAASLALGARAESFLQKVRSGVDWTFAKLLPPVLAIAGILLVIDGIRRAI